MPRISRPNVSYKPTTDKDKYNKLISLSDKFSVYQNSVNVTDKSQTIFVELLKLYFDLIAQPNERSIQCNLIIDSFLYLISPQGLVITKNNPNLLATTLAKITELRDDINKKPENPESCVYLGKFLKDVEEILENI